MTDVAGVSDVTGVAGVSDATGVSGVSAPTSALVSERLGFADLVDRLAAEAPRAISLAS